MSNDNYLWVKEYKAKLQLEYPEEGYEIGALNMKIWTGKQGAIEFEVALKAQCYKDLDLPITEETSYKEVEEMVNKHFEKKASKIKENYNKNKKNNSKYF